MTREPKPPADLAIDVSLVRALLYDQHPDLAQLPLIDLGEGWDNRLFRLGDALAVRLPRRAAAAALIEHEQRWLPLLAPRLPLLVPAPLRVGHPGDRYPWSWSITPWFPGQSALIAPPQDAVRTAAALGRFLRALHEPAPSDAPHNPWRGIPIAERTPILTRHLQQLGGLVDSNAALRLWERALSAPAWAGPRVWIHGDLHPGNLLIDDGALAAVIDFGDLTAGDPATDLSVMWMLLPAAARPAFLAAACGGLDIDNALVMRARGWALALGLACMVNSRDDPELGALGEATVREALQDER
jgi:aminoglycoside phosphotransferase (APT) family kinase protein